MYVVVSFKNAKLCINKSKAVKDYVFDSFQAEKWMKRSEHDLAKETILYSFDENLHNKLIRFEPISNMLHVLCGERPVPTFRHTFRKRIKELDEIALNCYYKIDNLFCYGDKNKVITEITQGKKFVPNANASNALETVTDSGLVFCGEITWSTFRQKYYYYDNEKYKSIISKLEEWTNDTFDSLYKKYTLIDLLLYLAYDMNLKDEMIEFFQENKIMPFVHIVNKNLTDAASFTNAAKSVNNFNLARRVVNSAPLYKVNLNGTFIFEINDERIVKAIECGNRFATYLDGGLARVIAFKDEIDLEFLESEDFKRLT